MNNVQIRKSRTSLNLKCDTSKLNLGTNLKLTPRTTCDVLPELTPATATFDQDTPLSALDGRHSFKRRRFNRKTLEPNAFSDSNMKSFKRKLTILEEYGLPNDITYKPGLKNFESDHSILSRKSITMADFWGTKVSQSLLSSPNLRQAANTLKHKYLIQNRTIEHSLLYPKHPRKMDISTVIRMKSKPNNSGLSSKSCPHPEFFSDTTAPNIKLAKHKGKTKELCAIYNIMKSCDQLYKEGQLHMQSLNNPAMFDETIVKKLARKDLEQIERFRKYLN